MIFVFISMMFFFIQNASNKELGARYQTDTAALARFQLIAHAMMAVVLTVMEIPTWKQDAAGFSLGMGLMALLYGILFLATVILVTKALSCGPVGTTTLVVNLSLVLSVTCGVLFFGDKITLTRILGIPCVLVTLVLSAVGGKSGQKGSTQWVILMLTAFLGDGLLAITQKTFVYLYPEGAIYFFLMISVFCGLIADGIICFANKGKPSEPLQGNKLTVFVLLAMVVGVSTVFGTSYTMKALTELDSVVVFPIRQGGLILIMTLYGIIRFKDKFDWKTAVMLITGIGGIVLLNL